MTSPSPTRASPDPSAELQELERLLHASHDTAIFEVLQQFASRLKKRRQEFFGAPGALLLRPIDCETARERGVWPDEEDEFRVLQGDIVFTSSAYSMGERLEDGYFALANVTCDLVPQRRDHVILLPVRAVHQPESPEETERVRSLLGELLSFKSARRMYLPPLPGDETNVLARFIDFDGIAQADSVSIEMAERIASLSVTGWRIFGVHLRRLLTRAGDNEVKLRSRWT